MNLYCPATDFIYFNYCAVQQNSVSGHFKTLRRTGKEALDDRLDFAAQNTFVRPGETRVSQIGCASGKNLFVGSLNMRMRAYHRTDLPVEKTRKRNLFRGCLGVKIHKDDLCLLAQSFYFFSDEQKWVFQRWHECAALGIQHRDKD